MSEDTSKGESESVSVPAPTVEPETSDEVASIDALTEQLGSLKTSDVRLDFNPDTQAEVREMLSEERVRTLVGECLDVDDVAECSVVRLGSKSFDVESAKVLAETLVKMKEVQEADFADIIAGRHHDVAITALETLCGATKEWASLRKANLSDNALGPAGVKACSVLLHERSELEEVRFNNNGLSAEAAPLITSLLLYRGETENTKLRVLEFYNNLLRNEGAEALAPIVRQSPNLEKFVFSTTRLGPKGGEILARALQGHTQLRYLDVSDNNFDEDASALLVDVLRDQAELRVLDLGAISSGDEQTTAICTALIGTAPHLEVLGLNTNDLTDESAEAVGECVASKKELKRLNLEENEFSSSVVQIIERLTNEHTQLERIDVRTNDVRSADALSVARHVLSLSRPVELLLNGNPLDDTTIETLTTLFEEAGRSSSLGPLDECFDDEDEDGDDSDDE